MLSPSAIPNKMQQGNMEANNVIQKKKNKEDEKLQGDTKDEEYFEFCNHFTTKAFFMAIPCFLLFWGMFYFSSQEESNQHFGKVIFILMIFGLLHWLVEFDFEPRQDVKIKTVYRVNGKEVTHWVCISDGFMRFIYKNMKKTSASPCDVPSLFLVVSAATAVIQIAILTNMTDFFGLNCPYKSHWEFR